MGLLGLPDALSSFVEKTKPSCKVRWGGVGVAALVFSQIH